MNHNHLINNIKSSQQSEQDLYLELEKLPNDTSSFEMQKEIMEKINNTSQSRVALFRQLHVVYKMLGDNVTNNKIQLKDQIDVLNMMEKHLKQSRDELSKNKNLNISNLRMTEINTYFSDKYRAQYAILRLIIMFCLPLLVLVILRNRYIIPSSLSGILATIIIVIGLFMVVPRVLDIYARNNMVFSEYDFPFDPSDAPDNSNSNNQESEYGLLKKSGMEEGECIGPACCSTGMIFNNKRGVCVINPAKTD